MNKVTISPSNDSAKGLLQLATVAKLAKPPALFHHHWLLM